MNGLLSTVMCVVCLQITLLTKGNIERYRDRLILQ